MTNATVYIPSEIITITDASNKVYDSVDFETNNLNFVRVALVRHGATTILVNGTDYVITAIDTGYKFRVRITLTNAPMVGDELRLTMNTPYAASVDFLSGDVARIDFDNMQRSLENAAAQTATVAGSIGDSISDGDEALRKYVDEELGAIREKDREQDAKIDTAEILPRSGQVDTTQKTFFHDPNRILGQRGVPLYRVISILNGDEGALAKALYTQRQTGSFVSADNFRALSTETLTVGDETHEALVVTVPGNFNDFTFLAVEFNDADTELAKTIYIPVQTISNGFDWVISDARPQEDAQKRELRVRLVYDELRDVTQIKFHQEAVPSASDTSTEIYLYIGFFLRLAAIGSGDGGGDTNHFVRVVRKEGVDFGDRDYYVENAADIVQTDEYYIVNPAGGGDLPALRNGYFAIKGLDGTISYTAPKNGDTAFIYADRQIDITDTDGSVSHANESKIAAILIYEGERWVITNSYFKTANDCVETGAFANAEGNRNEATGDYSHAEGWNSDATGLVSHAEGSATLASGRVSHAQGQGTVAKTDFSFIAGRYGVLGDPDTLVGIAWGRFAPNTSDETASVDKDLIWKINKDGDTTQDGTVTAEDFVKADGTAITDLSGYYTKAESDSNDQAILGAAEASDVSTTTDLTDMPQTLGTANAGKILEVNTAGDGYELTDKPSSGNQGSSTFTGLTDSPNSYTGQGGKFLQVNTGESGLEFTDKPSGGGSDTPAHFVRTVRKEGRSISDKDYYVENVAEIVQTDEFYIVNPIANLLGDIPDADAGKFAIKASNGTITYTAPTNGDTAMVYADRQVDITDNDGNVSSVNENRIVGILVYEGNNWVITNSFFKNANACTETGGFANAEGNNNNARGSQSHAEGFTNNADGVNSHAEGFSNTASGSSSHAEGEGNRADGYVSHAGGSNNIVTTRFGHVHGRFGVLADPKTVSAVAYSSRFPNPTERAGDKDVNLIWKVNQDGDTTQTGTITAEDFVKTDGRPIENDRKQDIFKNYLHIDGATEVYDGTLHKGEAFVANNPSTVFTTPIKGGSQKWVGAYGTINMELYGNSKAFTWPQYQVTFYNESDYTIGDGASFPGISSVNNNAPILDLMYIKKAEYIWTPPPGNRDYLWYFTDPDINNGNEITFGYPRGLTPEIDNASTISIIDKLYIGYGTGYVDSDANDDLRTYLIGKKLNLIGVNGKSVLIDITASNSTISNFIFISPGLSYAGGVHDEADPSEVKWAWGSGDYFLIDVPEEDRDDLADILSGDYESYVYENNSGVSNPTIKNYWARYDTIVSDDTPVDSIGEDGQGWVSTDLSDISIRHEGSWVTKKDDKFANSVAVDDGKIKVGYSDGSTGFESSAFIPNPGNANGSRDLVAVVRASSGKVNLTPGTSTDTTGLINSLSDSAPDNDRIKGNHIRIGTIPENRLTTAAQAKLNALADGGGELNNKAIEALASDREWKAEVQEYDNAATPASPATIGVAYNSGNVDFVFPTSVNKAAVDALVLNRKFVMELPEGIFIFTPTAYSSSSVIGSTHHRERYVATITLLSGVPNSSTTNDNYQTTLYRAVPSITTFEGLTDTPSAIHTSDAGKVVKVNSAGDGLVFGTITPSSDVQTPENRTRVFANSALVGTGSSSTGWQFKSDNASLLPVGNAQETPAVAAGTGTYKGISIDIPKARWNAMDKIEITASHANQVVSGTVMPFYKADMRPGTRYTVGVSGSGRVKMQMYFEEDKNQLGTADRNSNRLVIEMTEGGTTGWYIGEVVFINDTGGHTKTGASTFTELSDTPSALTGQGGKFLQVNSAATALEFGDAPSGGGGGGLIVAKQLASFSPTRFGHTTLFTVDAGETLADYSFLDFKYTTYSRFNSNTGFIDMYKVSNIPMDVLFNGGDLWEDVDGLALIDGNVWMGRTTDNRRIVITSVASTYTIYGITLFKGGLP